MKNLLFNICFCCLVTQTAVAQRNDAIQPLSTSYDVEKYQKNITIGRVLLGTGITMIIIGGIVFA